MYHKQGIVIDNKWEEKGKKILKIFIEIHINDVELNNPNSNLVSTISY